MSSVLVNRYGSRPVVIAGGLMVGAAMITASFATSVMHLFICVGVIGGMYVIEKLTSLYKSFPFGILLAGDMVPCGQCL